MSQVGASVWDYVTDMPGVKLQSIVAKFGEPGKIALDYAGEMDSEEILERIQNRGYFFRVVVATALLIFAVWACIVGYAWREHKINDGGYMTEEFAVIERSEP